MSKEIYIVISATYNRICLAENKEEAINVVQDFIVLEKDYFEKEEKKPRIFKVIEEYELDELKKIK